MLMVVINTLNPDVKVHILLTVLHTFLKLRHVTSKENLSKYEDILALVITS